MTDQDAYNRNLIEEFRASRAANPSAVPLAGRPLVLITTTGAKSGQRRTTPLMYIPDNERLLIIASNLGAAIHPAWYHNLVAHPDVTVEVGTDTFEATATVLEGAERQRLWAAITEQYPFFVEHQAKTNRQIPIVALTRR